MLILVSFKERNLWEEDLVDNVLRKTPNSPKKQGMPHDGVKEPM